MIGTLHTKQTGCLSSRQKSLRCSLCRLQTSSDPDEEIWLLFFVNDSHAFFKTRLQGGSFLEDLLLQTGHPWVFLVFQKFWRHSLQTLWPHDRITGKMKISQHTGQVRSSTDSKSIIILSSNDLNFTFNFWSETSSKQPL